MKKIPLLPVLAILSAATLPAVHAATSVYSFNGLGLVVPDGSPSGLANVQEVASDIATIEEVTVTLTLSGTYNGDLYVYLKKDTGFSVLVNRVGRNGSGAGYGDDGFNVTLSDSAMSDIHTYQTTTTPSAGSPLTGTWRPDGRITDPDIVAFGDSRPALLSSFNGLSANGSWTLYVADLNGGDVHTLQSWSITVTGIVPESGSAVLAVTAAGLLLSRRRRPVNGLWRQRQ
jgi:subtilisin-like proprotein convertase family protein